MKRFRKISMFKNGKWVKWDGSDVPQVIIEELITQEELKKYYPKAWEALPRR